MESRAMEYKPKVKELWWRVRYAFHAVKLLHCSPRYGWMMANAVDDELEEMLTMEPKDALEEEVSYWDRD